MHIQFQGNDWQFSLGFSQIIIVLVVVLDMYVMNLFRFVCNFSESIDRLGGFSKDCEIVDRFCLLNVILRIVRRTLNIICSLTCSCWYHIRLVSIFISLDRVFLTFITQLIRILV